MAVSVDSLLRLPEGAAYTRRSGQASIKVAARGDTVYVTGTCDSLQRRADYYEALYHASRSALERREADYSEERRQRADTAGTAPASFMAGILFGATAATIIISKRNGK